MRSFVVSFINEPHANESAKSTENRLYPCSYCPYTTKWLSNLCVHERRHNAVGDNQSSVRRQSQSNNVAMSKNEHGGPQYTCQICLRTYRYQHSLERHMNTHRYKVAVHHIHQQKEQSALSTQVYAHQLYVYRGGADDKCYQPATIQMIYRHLNLGYVLC